MNIAIIPARGGSKRIPKKNIKTFAGKPMISYAIECAQRSGLFNEVFVSTDSADISDVALAYGANVPFLRHSSIADDMTPTVPVIRDFVSRIQQILERQIELVCCIYPCVPLLEERYLQQAFKKLSRSASLSSFCLGVTEFRSSPFRALVENEDGFIQPAFPENELMRSQDLARAFYDSGQFYLASAETWMSEDRVHQKAIPIVIDQLDCVDIDTESDWKYAEQLYKLKHS